VQARGDSPLYSTLLGRYTGATDTAFVVLAVEGLCLGGALPDGHRRMADGTVQEAHSVVGGQLPLPACLGSQGTRVRDQIGQYVRPSGPLQRVHEGWQATFVIRTGLLKLVSARCRRHTCGAVDLLIDRAASIPESSVSFVPYVFGLYPQEYDMRASILLDSFRVVCGSAPRESSRRSSTHCERARCT
jgi:hypothetical protein